MIDDIRLIILLPNILNCHFSLFFFQLLVLFSGHYKIFDIAGVLEFFMGYI